MLQVMLMSALAFAEPQELIMVDGRKVLLKEDGKWELAKPTECNNMMRSGYTANKKKTVVGEGVLYLKKDASFHYKVNAYPNQDDKIQVLLFRNNKTFRDKTFHLNFSDESFFKGIPVKPVKIPYEGDAYELKPRIMDPLWAHLISKKIKSFETPRHEVYSVQGMSAEEFRVKLTCINDEVKRTLAETPLKPPPKPKKKSKKKKKKKKKKK